MSSRKLKIQQHKSQVNNIMADCAENRRFFGVKVSLLGCFSTNAHTHIFLIKWFCLAGLSPSNACIYLLLYGFLHSASSLVLLSEKTPSHYYVFGQEQHKIILANRGLSLKELVQWWAKLSNIQYAEKIHYAKWYISHMNERQSLLTIYNSKFRFKITE